MSYYVYPGYPGYYPRAQAVPGPSGTYPGVCPPGYHWDGYKCVKGHGGGMGIGPPPADYVGQAAQSASPWHAVQYPQMGQYLVQVFGDYGQSTYVQHFVSERAARDQVNAIKALPWPTIGTQLVLSNCSPFPLLGSGVRSRAPGWYGQSASYGRPTSSPPDVYGPPRAGQMVPCAQIARWHVTSYGKGSPAFWVGG